ncbi:MAG: helix-turn-helix transcriptional regulator [Dyadobacter fermentans]
MASSVLRTHDIYDFSHLPNPLEVGNQPATSPKSYDRHYHPQAGMLEYSNISFPHLHVMNLKRKTNAAVTMVNDCPVDTVNFNFQLTGHNNIRYNGLDHHMNTKAGTHYMIYNPCNGYESDVDPASEMEVLLISLEKQFLMSCFTPGNHLNDRFWRCLDLQKTFSGSDRALKITPQMWHVIKEIRDSKVQGPMRNLYIQSKALELIVLQFDQLRRPSDLTENISQDDVEKLHQLRAFLDANFLSNLSLSQLSRECLLNEFKVKSGFKQLFGSSVFNYLKKIRMEHAAILLRDPARTVDEVADTLGYEHAQHFSTAFKNFTGTTPSSYRNGRGDNKSVFGRSCY